MHVATKTRKLYITFVAWLAVLVLTTSLTGCGSGGLSANQASSLPAVVSTPSTQILQKNPASQVPPVIPAKPKLRIHYLDVGQGDSILVQLPNGKNMLIDAGDNEAGPTLVSYLHSLRIQRLDVVIWTHPHADHIGSADVVTKNFSIGQVYMPDVAANTLSYRNLLTSMQEKGLKATQAKAGITFNLDPEINAEILAPNSSHYEDTNDYSTVLRLAYGKNSFLFTGDAQTTSEKEMLAAGSNLQADVLKVGHHGSHSSTSSAFLAKVKPEYAVISVGQGNDYGHPHKETLAALAKAGAKVYRTDESGTIIATSDGTTITFTTQKP